MSEKESAHGELSAVDQVWTGPRFIVLLIASLVVAFLVIIAIASVKHGGAWEALAHDPIKHTFETSTF